MDKSELYVVCWPMKVPFKERYDSFVSMGPTAFPGNDLYFKLDSEDAMALKLKYDQYNYVKSYSDWLDYIARDYRDQRIK